MIIVKRLPEVTRFGIQGAAPGVCKTLLFVDGPLASAFASAFSLLLHASLRLGVAAKHLILRAFLK